MAAAGDTAGAGAAAATAAPHPPPAPAKTPPSKAPTPTPPSPASAPSRWATSTTPLPGSSHHAPAPPSAASPSSTEVPTFTLLPPPPTPLTPTPLGTYTRTTAIDTIVSHFLASTTTTPRQIISLGAGTDTRALRLLSTSSHPNLTYHELDFPLITTRKLASLRAAPPTLVSPVLTLPPPPPPGTTSWTATSPSTPTSTLHVHGLDLRALHPSSPLPPGVDPTLPTLLISECCLCYLSPSDAASAISHFSSRIPDLGAVLYEPVRPEDSFGQMMVANLAARGIRMPTVEVFKTPGDQEERMRGVGFDEVKWRTVDAVWEGWVEGGEKERVDGLEGLDEVEEWLLLAGHYIVVWGWRGGRMVLPRG